MASKQQIEGFLKELYRANPNLKPLDDENLGTYYRILKRVPETAFRLGGKIVMKQKQIGWPGAGEIYQICRRLYKPEPVQRPVDPTVGMTAEQLPEGASDPMRHLPILAITNKEAK
jgi:hypothetical protein